MSVPRGSNTCGERDVPAGLSGVIAIAAGENHSLALRSNGTTTQTIIHAWRYNWFGISQKHGCFG